MKYTLYPLRAQLAAMDNVRIVLPEPVGPVINIDVPLMNPPLRILSRPSIYVGNFSSIEIFDSGISNTPAG